MLWKLLTLAAAGLALWSFLRKAIAIAGPREEARPRRPGAEDFVRCRACGAWRPEGGDCACRLPPTP